MKVMKGFETRNTAQGNGEENNSEFRLNSAQREETWLGSGEVGERWSEHQESEMR